MSPKNPYISRKQAEEFTQGVEQSIQDPINGRLLHYAYGIGGIGKSTLIDKLIETFAPKFQCAKIFFGINSPINTPMDLMKTLDEYLTGDIEEWDIDIFKELDEKRSKTLQRLESEAIQGESSDNQANKIAIIKSLGKLAKIATTAYGAITSGGTGAVASNAGGELLEAGIEKGIDSLVEGGSAYLEVVDFLKQHKATKDDPELQELITNPIPKLAKAFIETIIEKSHYKPILLFIDTYEKAASEFDEFLCKFLLCDQDLKNSPVRIVMAGRHSLGNKRYQRRFQQYDIAEKQLDKFNEKETKAYLKEIGITKPKEINKYWKATKGYPYYLNLIRKQKENGKNIKLSRGGRDMVDLLLNDFTDIEKRVISIAAYCRWFDQSIIEYLLNKNNIDQKPQDDSDWFEWLVNLDFVIEDDHYHLDDVARDIIRQTEYKNNKKSFVFTEIHQQLNEYFQQLANDAVAPEELVTEKYEDPDWCEYIIESTYHALFADKKQGQIKLLTHFFEGVYLQEPDVAKKSLYAVLEEADLDEFKLLPGNSKKFLQSISFAIVFGWKYVGMNPDKYKISLKSEEDKIELEASEFFKSAIESALEKCFKEAENLAGLAKCFGLLGNFIRSKQLQQRLSLIKQAEAEIEIVGTNDYPKLSGVIFRFLGDTLFKLERYEEALINYDKAIELNPNDSIAWENRGNTLFNLERYEEALTNYDKGIELDPDNSDAWKNRGTILFNLERYEEALTNYDQAIELNPDDSITWIVRGDTLFTLERYEESLTNYDQAIELNPDNSIAWNMRALTLSIQGDFEKAISDIDQAIKLDPKQVLNVANKGIILARQGNYNGAIKYCNQAETMNPDHEVVYYAKACYYALQNNESQAIENLSKAISIDPRRCRLAAKKDPEFDRLRNNSEFQALITAC